MAERLASGVAAAHVQYDVDDPFSNGPAMNHMRALRWHQDQPLESEYAVVLEDDAVPVDGFCDQLDMVLDVAPSDYVCLYLGTGYPVQWQHILRKEVDPFGDDPHFLLLPEVLNMVGYAVRYSLVENLANYLQSGAHQMGPDRSATRFVRDLRLTVAYTRPSILNHLDGEPAVKERFDGQERDRPRHAWKFGARERWSNASHLVQPPKLVAVDHRGEWYEVETTERVHEDDDAAT